jgi:VIT1/CCC1 family predicted Fe2+/Mn2+ transporter
MSSEEQARDRRLLTEAERLRGRSWRIVPHPGPVSEQGNAAGGKSGALRAGIFGLNDGLVSNLSLIFGVAGAGVSNHVVIVAGVAGLLAGAFSMGAGEYVSMRVQREVFERLIHLEAHELGTQPEEERAELVDIYVSKGFSRDLAERIADEVHGDPELALDTHAREELGLDPQEGLGSPWAAAGTSFATFSMGAIVPLVPFFFTEGGPAVLISSLIAALTLFGVGAGVSYLTGRPLWLSGARMLLIGALAAGITYGVGTLLNVTVA